MTNWQTQSLTPRNWLAAARKSQAAWIPHAKIRLRRSISNGVLAQTLTIQRHPIGRKLQLYQNLVPTGC
jgi:hypothetical protein